MSSFDIFLVPTAIQYSKYAKQIKELSLKYRTPSFPHVTLIEVLEANESDLITKVKGIVKNFQKIEVEVFGMNFTNTTYQCVFAQIKMSPQLLSLYNELDHTLQYSNKSPFFPHMSLVYGDISPEDKSDITKNITVDDKLVLDKLVIYQDGPLPSDWRPVTEFELN